MIFLEINELFFNSSFYLHKWPKQRKLILILILQWYMYSFSRSYFYIWCPLKMFTCFNIKKSYFSHTVHCCSTSIHPQSEWLLVAVCSDWSALIGLRRQSRLCLTSATSAGASVPMAYLNAQFLNTGCVHFLVGWVFWNFHSISKAPRPA